MRSTVRCSGAWIKRCSGEVAVQGGTAHLGAFNHQVQRGGDTVLAEHMIGGVEDEGAAGSGIGVGRSWYIFGH